MMNRRDFFSWSAAAGVAGILVSPQEAVASLSPLSSARPGDPLKDALEEVEASLLRIQKLDLRGTDATAAHGSPPGIQLEGICRVG